MDSKKNKKVIQLLSKAYPYACCELEHKNEFELLIATILSAQCTDIRVNEITRKLFKIYKTPEEFVNMGKDKLSQLIKSCGLYRNKSKNIIQTCKLLIENYEGKIPKEFDELVRLPGVGRKTANVVLSNAFGIPAMAVDTHVHRVSNRIGLVKAEDVRNTEQQLMQEIPINDWIKMHHILIFHGRQVCHAKNPDCKNCVIKEYCDFTNKGFK